jgi:hypothetical protein
MNDARLALSRVQFRDTFVMRETSDIFVAHMTQFAATRPEEAAALEAAALVESLEQAYGCGAVASPRIASRSSIRTASRSSRSTARS